ncbi:MAG: NUDIX domain-containing protein [Microscillaceae bacterium]|nr:NUDIX domain-containing protein [Microscillaceae bacterium]MDW8460174.1 NUDIX domain-containing protein [Cytophagales bacterium]
MNIFIHQTQIKISNKSAYQFSIKKYIFIDATQQDWDVNKLLGNVVFQNLSWEAVQEILSFLIQNPENKIKKIVILTHDKRALCQKIKSEFHLLQASGGIVQKDKQVLMIYRLGKWDLPKGKLEPNEKFSLAAVREIEEETGIKAEIVKKITTTWHFYWQDNQKILKQTKWYWLLCQEESQTKPQTEENIEKITWVSREQLPDLLKESYASIAFVFRRFMKIK